MKTDGLADAWAAEAARDGGVEVIAATGDGDAAAGLEIGIGDAALIEGAPHAATNNATRTQERAVVNVAKAF